MKDCFFKYDSETQKTDEICCQSISGDWIGRGEPRKIHPKLKKPDITRQENVDATKQYFIVKI